MGAFSLKKKLSRPLCLVCYTLHNILMPIALVMGYNKGAAACQEALLQNMSEGR